VVEEKREGADMPAGVREWLLQLERRVSELEHERVLARRRRLRGFVYLLVVLVAYAVYLYRVTDLL